MVMSIQWRKWFPSPTGVNHYEYGANARLAEVEIDNEFPSPTGVNHYEYKLYSVECSLEMVDSFRPLQGLTIMNPLKIWR